MGELIDILKVILWSSFKFVLGPFWLAYYNQKKDYDFTLFEKLLYPVIGGMLGVVVFTYFGEWLFMFWHYAKNKFKRTVKKRAVFSKPVADIEQPIEIKYSYIGKNVTPTPKIFTPQNRRIIRIWNKYGLTRLAFLTPILFSIPLGTIIATRFVHNRKKIFLYMFISIVFWSIVITSFSEVRDKIKAKRINNEKLK